MEETTQPLGVLLWRSLRSVLVWADSAPAQRSTLFAPGAYERRMADLLGADAPPTVVAACEALAQLLSRPTRVQPDHVAGHCITLANWAGDHEKRGTRLAFLTAAALCCPFDGFLALLVGREARHQALHATAENWLERAITVSRGGEQWEVYARAHIAYGNMLIARGAFPAARRHLHRAERRGMRHGLTEVRAMALHDLFVVEAECNHLPAAHRYAREALGAYRAGDPRLVNLAFDLAFVWMREGYFETALPIFRSLLPLVEPRFLPHMYGAIARAAGACGLAVEHAHAVRALAALPCGPGTAEARLDSAHGAISLTAWEDAQAHAELALAVAQERKERKVELLAETLLESIHQRKAQGLGRAGETSLQAQDLAFDLAEVLRGCPAVSAA